MASAIGLLQMKFWGYVATQIEMGTWIYTSLGSLVTALAKGIDDIFVLFWSPMYLMIAVFVVRYTWKIRDHFV